MPYKATERNKKYLRLYKQGKSIGFTMRSSLKAKGLIPRANGTYRVSNKYNTPVRMVNRTRKARKGGAWWSSSPTKEQVAQKAANNAKQRAAYNSARSKSRVANVLGQKALNKGNVVYTNKERIASELNAKLHTIANTYGVEFDKLESDVKHAALPPKTVIDTLKGLITQLESQTSAAAGGGLDAQQKALLLTIPFGAGQLTLKVLRVALYLAITFMAVLATFSLGGALLMLGVNPFGATAILPNTGFESTSEFYNSMMGKPQNIIN